MPFGKQRQREHKRTEEITTSLSHVLAATEKVMHTLASNVGNVAFNVAVNRLSVNDVDSSVDNAVDNGVDNGVVELPQRVIINDFDVDLNAIW